MESPINRTLRLRRLRASNKGYSTEKNAKWQKNNRAKYLAHKAVSYALSVKKIIRQPCEVCGDHKSEAHHDDYDQPFIIRWLCRKHHAELHKKRRAHF